MSYKLVQVWPPRRGLYEETLAHVLRMDRVRDIQTPTDLGRYDIIPSRFRIPGAKCLYSFSLLSAPFTQDK